MTLPGHPNKTDNRDNDDDGYYRNHPNRAKIEQRMRDQSRSPPIETGETEQAQFG